MRKIKILFYTLLPLLIIGFIAKWVLFDYVVSSGKRVGNLTKFSKKGKLLKTWEGTLDEGSGDKLTSYFSVRSEEIAQALFEHEGRKVIIFYQEHLWGWPRDTKYNVVEWKSFEEGVSGANTSTQNGVAGTDQDKNKDKVYKQDELLQALGQGYFCALLGSLYSNQKLYKEVKAHLEQFNLFLFKRIKDCN